MRVLAQNPKAAARGARTPLRNQPTPLGQIRNPKSEIRNKDQNPKSRNVQNPPGGPRGFGHSLLRSFGFVSDFGFRISDLFSRFCPISIEPHPPPLRPIRNPQSAIRNPQGGFVLVAVLVVILLVSMVAVSLLFRLRAEETAAAAGNGGEQAWAAAMSGVYEAMRVAGKITPGSLDWQDDPASFGEQLVFDDGSDRWYFTVYTMGDAELQELRYGLTDEAGKLNLNQATEEMLGKLPKMTPYLVQGLLDFVDADNTPHPEGAEQEYYDTLANPYGIFNSTLTTLEELLLVRGFTPALLYGEDANLNFQLDANENDSDEQFPPDNGDSKLDCGLRPYLTVSSYDLNEDSEGLPRTDLTDPEQTFPEDKFPAPVLAYIAALRTNGTTVAHPAELLEAKGKFKGPDGKEVEMESGVGKAELPAVLDYFTTTFDYELPGLININTASAAVLQTLPGVDEALAESIVSARKNLRLEQRRTPAWLYQEGLVTADVFKKLAPLITARSYQYHFQVVGYGIPSGRYRVLEVGIDTAPLKPAITYLRDITKLGMPFRIDTTGGASWDILSKLKPRSPLKLGATAKEAPHG